MKMMLYNIKESDLFLEALKSCQDSILLQLQDGQWYDFNKQSDVIRSFFQIKQTGIDRIALRLKIGRDVERLYRFMALQ